MPRFSENEKKRINEKLLTEGERLFLTHGIKKVTIDDLVKAAGIAKASFYTFYESKEYLYLDIVQNIQQTIFAELNTLLDSNSDSSSEERVLQVFEAMSKMILQYPVLIHMDTATIELIARKVSKERLSAFREQNFDAAQALLNHGVRFSCDIQTVSHAFQAIYHSWMYLRDQGEQIQSTVTNIILRGVVSQIVIK
ncbi:TetR family transcriptional regulator [Fontibacillus phaseoli]|uniref:TetR family transcriptional regulator n=1 Tax=Fontibacillus phaseoli TaxID=1416533 RepID=A0A369BID8_9BACL|nr:TetR/AcrR family transcriptional regulator [Fontibacillus phaseoli]RCX21339.1 TetR family transcriptional regulator [Fontibacillus phaseoli]